jgi:hypothetical protein
MSTVTWHTNISYALDTARSTRKPVLLDFYNPE